MVCKRTTETMTCGLGWADTSLWHAVPSLFSIWIAILLKLLTHCGIFVCSLGNWKQKGHSYPKFVHYNINLCFGRVCQLLRSYSTRFEWVCVCKKKQLVFSSGWIVVRFKMVMMGTVEEWLGWNGDGDGDGDGGGYGYQNNKWIKNTSISRYNIKNNNNKWTKNQSLRN